jgi:hypothetical protein
MALDITELFVPELREFRNTGQDEFKLLSAFFIKSSGPGSVVGIAYGLDGPGIESRWGEFFRTCPDRPWGPPSLLYNG